MGTPEFAVPSLHALATFPAEIAGVYTQPDRPAGRGRHEAAPPVKRAALALGLPVFQPASLRPAAEVERLAALRPDVIVVAAFGQILRPNVISIPPHGILNVHASLLPRWRGAAPIAAAILAGDEETGITLMQIDPGMDTGPMLRKLAIPIEDSDTTGTLTDKLAEAGARLLRDSLADYLAGKITPEPQDNSLATLAPRITTEDAVLDWTMPAADLARQVRAFQPWPGARTALDGKQLTIIAATANDNGSAAPGAIVPRGKSGLAIGTGRGTLEIQRLQLQGGRPMDTAAFRAGHHGLAGKTVPS